MSEPVVEVEDLVVEFRRQGRKHKDTKFRAVDRVSFSIDRGEVLGLVGESGSGKTTIGRALLGLVRPAGGTIRFLGQDVTGHAPGQPPELARGMQVVFQDPFGSLNPSRTVEETLCEPLEVHRHLSTAQAQERVKALLDSVGLPANAAGRYPFTFSGGQRQRIALARALATEPQLVICDEAVSALDLVTRAQVVNILLALQQQSSSSFLFIAHDVPIVTHVSQRTVVLYRGQIMEQGPAGEVRNHARHPYTQALLLAVPSTSPSEQEHRRKLREGLKSTAAAAAPAPDGCPFAPRCPFAAEVCSARRPQPVSSGAVKVACHLYDTSSGHPQADAVAAGQVVSLLENSCRESSTTV